MKRLEKIKVNPFLLNKKELGELKGRGDVYNTNSYVACECTYYDYGVTYNINTEFGCACRCVS
jgi:hypothetical protein